VRPVIAKSDEIAAQPTRSVQVHKSISTLPQLNNIALLALRPAPRR
jgi:hypothetical protein